MGRRLNATTIVPAPPGDGGGGFHTIGPDDDVPDWAVEHIGDHLWADGGSGDGQDGPAKSANKPEWVDWAVANGADRADAEAMTKDELIDRYSGS